MPRMLAIAAALATVLTVAACGSAQLAADAPQAAGADPAADAAEQAQPQPESLASESGASQTAEGAGGALRSGTLNIAAALDAGEPGLPATSGASIDDVLRLGAVATWIDAPDTLAISLPASTDCWPSATEPVVESASQLSLEFVAGECVAFDSARTYTVEVPEGIDAGADLEVAIEGLAHHFTLTLPAG